MSTTTKKILVLARRDPEEAMRVAAGLTIFGHGVRLVFMGQPLTDAVMQGANAELLELTDIEPETTIAAMSDMLDLLKPEALAAAISESDGVINI